MSASPPPALTVPGPRAASIIGPRGNLLQFFRDPIRFMDQAFQRFGPIVTLVEGGRVGFSQRGGPGIVLVHGPRLTREVQSQTDVFYAVGEQLSQQTAGQRESPRRQALQDISVHVLSTNGERHRRHRRLLAPYFHKQHVEAYHADMVHLTQAVLDGWVADERRDIRAEMNRLTLRVVLKTLFGDAERVGDDIGQSMQQALNLAIPSLLLPYDLPGLPYYRWGHAAQRLTRGVQALIDRRRSQSPGARTANDMLTSLLEARDEDGSALSDVEVVGNLFAIFLAGHETSSSALTWTLFLLSQHPRYAADLLTELDDLLHGAPPTVAQMNQVPLLECTIKESLRLLPPIPYSTRYACQATELAGFPIPAGTDVFVSLYHTHRMPELYAQPNVFNPYRWLGIERDVFEFTPFNSGPRMCLGAGFAMQEMKLMLAMILQRYRLEFIPNTRVDRFVGFTMAVKSGLPMIVRKQDRQFTRPVGRARGNVHQMLELAA